MIPTRWNNPKVKSSRKKEFTKLLAEYKVANHSIKTLEEKGMGDHVLCSRAKSKVRALEKMIDDSDIWMLPSE